MKLTYFLPQVVHNENNMHDTVCVCVCNLSLLLSSRSGSVDLEPLPSQLTALFQPIAEEALHQQVKVPSPSPCQSRLSRRQITSSSPTPGSTGPSPASKQPTWFRAPDQRDTGCFWSDRARHAGETMSSPLTTREKQ
ncbi:hypothetical protein INR49_032161, partial [Caranx melampygus]